MDECRMHCERRVELSFDPTWVSLLFLITGLTAAAICYVLYVIWFENVRVIWVDSGNEIDVNPTNGVAPSKKDSSGHNRG